MALIPKSPLDGIRKALENHSKTLQTVINQIQEFHPLAFTSLEELLRNFEKVKADLEAKITGVMDEFEHQSSTATVAAANPATTSLAAKMLGPLGPIIKIVRTLVDAWAMINLIMVIIVQYTRIVTLIALKIAEMGAAIVAMGLNFLKNFLSNLMSELYAFLAEIKKMAIEYAKTQIRTTLVNMWEKDKVALQEELDASLSDGFAITPEIEQKQEMLRSRINVLESAIKAINSALKPAQASI